MQIILTISKSRFLILLIALSFVVACSPVWALTHRIGTQNNITYAWTGQEYIKTSRDDRLFNASGSDLQQAIWYLNDTYGGGEVTLPSSNITLSSPIELENSVTIQGTSGSNIILNSGITAFRFTDNISYARLKDIDIYPSSNHFTGQIPIINLTATRNSYVRQCKIEDINIINNHYNASSWADAFVALELYVNGGDMIENYIERLRVGDNFTIGGGCGKLINFVVSDDGATDGWCNSNIFHDCWAVMYGELVDFTGVASGAQCGHNSFYHIVGETASWSTHGFHGIKTYGNTFIDCFLWDIHYATNFDYVFNVSTTSTYCMIIATHHGDYTAENFSYTRMLLDSGSLTTFVSRWYNKFAGETDFVNLSSDGVWQNTYPNDDNLSLYLPFCEGIGTVGYDRSQYRNDCSITVSGTGWGDGLLGNALYFDGNDFGVVSTSGDLNITDALSIEFWLNPNAVGRNILSKGNSAYRVKLISSTEMYFRLNGVSTGVYLVSDSSYMNAWHHFVFTYDGSQSRMYVDGRFKDNISCSGAIGTSTDDLYIGRDTGETNNLSGWLDEVRIYNCSLSSASVQAHYLHGVQSHGYVVSNNFSIFNTDWEPYWRVPLTEPSSPVEGMIYSNSTDNHCYYYNGANWIIMSTVLSAGTTSAYNGSWIPHGLPGDPDGLGSITLSLRGSSTYNATRILRVPTVLASNTTHFQIEFMMWETDGWTLVPVTVAEAQTVYWDAVYRG